MNEIWKGFTSIITVLFVCGIFFGAGYLLSNYRATEQLNKANQQLEEQQRKYDELIKESEARVRQSEDRVREANERISNIRAELLGKVSDNGEATKELSAIIEQIRKQKLDIQI